MNFSPFAHIKSSKSLSPSRGSTLAFALVAVLGGFAEKKANGAVYPTGTNLNNPVIDAQKFTVANGGFAVGIETFKPDGTIINQTSGGLLTSPDGVNRTVIGAFHAYQQALAVDSNARVRVLTGSNFLNDRGLIIPVIEILIAPGADGTLNNCDLLALRLPYGVPNTGMFLIGTPIEGDTTITVGNGNRLTIQQGLEGNIPARDGNFGVFHGTFSFNAPVVSNINMNISRYDESITNTGVSANGDSGAHAMKLLSLVFSDSGRMLSGEYIGTNLGFVGDRLSGNSASVLSDSFSPVAIPFLNSAVTVVPEPAILTSLIIFSTLALRRR